MPQSSTKPFSGIFVSYRREDSAGHAGRLFDRLVNHFGKDRIFMDVDTIEPGEDFVAVIEKAVGSCEILIAVIGKNWLVPEGNTGRLDNPNNFVRLEIAAALRRDVRVIPVLVQRASMPKSQDLPEDLAPLSRKNAVELTDPRWQSDVDQLISFMDRVIAKREADAEAAKQAEEEQQQREAKEKRRQEEEQQLRLAEGAARQAEEDRQRLEEKKRRRTEKENQLRLAEEEAKQRVAAERLRAEKERKAAEERAKQEVLEVSKRRAEEERVRVEGERRAQQEVERHRVEVEQEMERRRLETEKQAHAEEKLIRHKAEEAQRKSAAEQTRHTSLVEKQAQPDPPAITRIPVSGHTAQPYESHAMGNTTDATLLRADSGNRTMLLVIIAFVVVVAMVVLIWIKLGTEGEQLSAKRSASTQQTAGVPSTTQPPPGMVYVPGGSFTMGRDKSDGGDDYEHPAHGVIVKAFFIDSYKVTCLDYKKFVEESGHSAPASWKRRVCPPVTPVTGVIWDDADAFCRARGKQLPTESQWEFAARGTDGRRYPWGNEWRVGLANADGASKSMVDVDSFPEGKSPFGAFDMVGNAWEWTASDMTAYPGGKLPEQPAPGTKVLRGGSYLSTKNEATATYRFGWRAREESSYAETGFRCVKASDITGK